MSDLQTDVAVNGNKITGTLKYVSEGQLPSAFGAGNFLVLKWSDIDTHATSLKVGLVPSEGTGLVEVIDDPDANGAFKITDKDGQRFVMLSSAGGYGTSGYSDLLQKFDLSGLVLEEEA